MNIMCSKRHLDDDLDKYIGKDVWVKVRINTDYSNYKGYIRIVGKENRKGSIYYTVNVAKTYGEDVFLADSPRVIDAKLRYTTTLHEWDIVVDYPIQVLTTDELFVIEGEE